MTHTLNEPSLLILDRASTHLDKEKCYPVYDDESTPNNYYSFIPP